MSDNFPKIGDILAANKIAAQDALRPLYVGDIYYNDGEGKVVELLSTITKPPRQYQNHAGVVVSMPITQAQAKVMIRAFRNANPIESACLLCGTDIQRYTEMYRTWELGPPPGDPDDENDTRPKYSKIWEKAWKFLDPFFRAVEIADILAEREMLAVIQQAALNPLPKHEHVVKKITDHEGNVTTVSTMKTTETEKDWAAAKWWLEVHDPSKYAPRRNVNTSGEIEVSTKAIDPLAEILRGIEAIGRQPLPVPCQEAEVIEIDEPGDTDR